MDDLQQTLNSLGLEEDRRQVERKQSAQAEDLIQSRLSIKYPMMHKLFQVRVSEEPAREFFVGEQNSRTSM